MKVKNISDKIIGLGTVTVLPEETKAVPLAFETNPTLTIYREMGFIEIIDSPQQTFVAEPKEITPEVVKEPERDADEVVEDIKNLRKAQLAAIKSMTDEEIGKLAKELGIKPASCKDQADVRRKVTAALKKAV